MCMPICSGPIAVCNFVFITVSCAIFATEPDSDNPWVFFAIFNLLINAVSAVLAIMLLCRQNSLKIRLANAIYAAIMALHVLNVGFAIFLLFEGLASLSCSDAEGVAYDNCRDDNRSLSYSMCAVAVITGLIIQALIFWRYLKYY